jgi:MOSC domain-containing protein YiiM
MTIVSLRIGMPRRELRRSGELYTGGAKAPTTEAVLRFAGFEGDRVANPDFHGGEDRAACVYPAGHYALWKAERGFDLGFGAFCENLSVDGLVEGDVRIGDKVRLGEALAQVSLPRDPCATIDRLLEIPDIHRLARESGRCGFHMRVLEEGRVRLGDRFEVVERDAAAISLALVLDLYHGRSRDRALARRLMDLPAFAEEGKRYLAKKGLA